MKHAFWATALSFSVVCTVQAEQPPAKGGQRGGAPAASPSKTYPVQAILDEMVLPNSEDMYPAHYSVSFPDRASHRNQWGANNQGDPRTRSYAYVDRKIRADDRGPAGTGYSYENLSLATIPAGDTVRRYPWVVVGDAWQMRNVSTNSRVHVRNIRHQALTFDGKWIDAGFNSLTAQPKSYGSWHNIWLGPGMASGNGQGHALDIGVGYALSDGRIEPDGGSSLGSIGLGRRYLGVSSGTRTPLELYSSFVWHFYPLPGFDRTRAELEKSMAGTVICMEVRLILHDPGKPDDRDESAMLVNVGADYYNMSNRAAYIGGAMHGRWKRITNDWSLSCATDIAADLLKANPPPGFTK
ncbi:MAG TPA: hypothetical protein PKA20_14980 [Burkholderiaceae bacterium]|nr:hypothetical protein [Burkholderiaceae bacterium]